MQWLFNQPKLGVDGGTLCVTVRADRVVSNDPAAK